MVEPDPVLKIYRTLSPENARVRWGPGGILADTIILTAVLEFGPTEILPPVGAISKHPGVSADPAVKPAAHTRAESRGSRPSKADAGEKRTVRWREMDSNFRFRAR